MTTAHSSTGLGPAPRQAAIVGLNAETAALLPALLEAPGLQVVKVLNPDVEDLSRLTLHPGLEIVIDTTRSASVAARLRRLPLKKVDIVSGVGARILWSSVRGAPEASGRDHVLRCLQEVRGTAGLGRHRDEILRMIVNAAVKATGADAGSIMVLDPARRKLTIEASVGLDEQIVLSTAQDADCGVAGSALRSGEPVLIRGAADRRAHRAAYERTDLASSVCCPMLHGDEAVGVISVSGRDSSRLLGPDDAALLSDLGRLAAEAVKAAWEGEAAQPGTQAQGLVHSAQEILAMRYRFEERMNLLLMKIANAFGANVSTWYEFCPEDGLFVAKASSAQGPESGKGKARFLDDFFAQRVLKTDNTFCVNAAGRTPRSKKWYLIQPVRCGQELAGALFVQLNSEKNALKEESAILRRVGELLAREIGRSRNMEAIKSRSVKFSAITQVAHDIAGSATLAELARLVLSSAGSILEAETCVLRLRNSADEGLRLCDALSHRNPAWLKDILSLDEMILADMGPGRAAALFPDLRESPYNVDLLGSESALVVMLEMDGEALGSLSLYDKQSADLAGTRSFGESDREMLISLGTHAARALEKFFPFPAPASWTPASLPG